MNKLKTLPFVISFGVIVAGLVAWKQGLFSAVETGDIYKALCDACFVPGVLLVSFGLLAFIAYGGVFDIFTYGFRMVRLLFISFRKDKELPYYEYKLAKAEKRLKPRYYGLKTGLVFLGLAVIFLILFETV